MVIMSKRYHSSSESSSDSDEDNGNFKRKKRNNYKNYRNDIIFDNSNEDYDNSYKQLKVINTNPNPKEQFLNNQKLINDRKKLETRLKGLTKYDDLYDQNESTGSFDNDLNRNYYKIDNSLINVNKSGYDFPQKTTVKQISTVVCDYNIVNEFEDEPDVEPETVAVNTELDPRLKRAEICVEKAKEDDLPELPLKQRVRMFLAERKPSEAYKALSLEVSKLEINKYREDLITIALDWFPSFIDSQINPQDAYVEAEYIYSFHSVMRDVFSLKTKVSKFWEELVINIDKFIVQSKIQQLHQLLAKLRRILVVDIRDYLIAEDVKISLKATTIIVDHKSKIEQIRVADREQFARKYEEQSNVSSSSMKSMTTLSSKPLNTLINPLIQKTTPLMHSTDHFPKTSLYFTPQSSIYSSTLSNVQSLSLNQNQVIRPQNKVQNVPQLISHSNEQNSSKISTKKSTIISLKPKVYPQNQTQNDHTIKPISVTSEDTLQSHSQTSTDMFSSRHQTSSPVSMTSNSSTSSGGDQVVIEQIVTLLKQEQYTRLVQMIYRHAMTSNSTVIEDFGKALRLACRPTDSVYEKFRKLYDTMKLNSCNDMQRHNIIVQKLLKEFSYTVRYNPKEWLLIRSFTTEHLKDLTHNPFDEKIIPVKHNITIRCNYINASNNLIIDYEAINTEIPLIAMNAILKDPRIEFKCDLITNQIEVIPFEEEENCGKFSPYRSESSMSPTSPRSDNEDEEEIVEIEQSYDVSNSERDETPISGSKTDSNLKINNKSVPETTNSSSKTINDKPKTGSPVKKPLDLDSLAQLPVTKQKRINFDLSELKRIQRTVQVSSDSSDDE